MTPNEKQKERQAFYLEKLQQASNEAVAAGTYLRGAYNAYLHKEIKKDKEFAKTICELTEEILENLEKIQEPENKRSHSMIRYSWLKLNARAKETCENIQQR